MEQLDLNQIRTFVKIIEAGSFTKAAALLRQPKSRISRRLAALEKELGLQLVYRTTRQLQLTEVGRQYYERTRSLIEGLESLSVEMQENTNEISGHIRLTASDDMGALVMPGLLDEFSKFYPRVTFDVHLSQAYVDLVRESVDVAFRAGKLKDSSLRAKKISVIKSIFVATPGFVERYRQIEDVTQISQLPFYALGSSGKLEVVRNSDGKRQALKVKVVASANSPALLVGLALGGRGLSFVPEFLCREHLNSGRLVHVLKGYRSDEVPLSIVTPEQKEQPLRVKKFIEFATKKLKEVL